MNNNNKNNILMRNINFDFVFKAHHLPEPDIYRDILVFSKCFILLRNACQGYMFWEKIAYFQIVSGFLRNSLSLQCFQFK